MLIIKKIKIKKIAIYGSFFVLATAAITAFLVIKLQKPKIKNDIDNEYKVTINGAVNKPGDYHFNKPLTIQEIIFKAEVKTNADIYSLQLEKIINKNQEIVVPFQIGTIEKIKWEDLKSIEQLTALGVSKNVATKIIDFRRHNKETTWEKILTIKGIGKVTVNQLKELIDLS